MQKSKVGIRKWLSFILAGLIGQIAWSMENMYLSPFAYYVSESYSFIPLMTALSAIVATVTTLFVGALSDRLGKRKSFICYGYILWGISIMAFALFDYKSPISIVGTTACALAGSMVVIFDCVMTFFGSTANDACFNAFVTENTEESYRGKVESVISILPMAAMIIITVLTGFFNETGNEKWWIYFIILGVICIVSGVICIFLLPKDKKEPNKDETYFKNIFYGFKPSVVKANPYLYIVLIAFCVFSIAIQIFMPYLVVYINNFLGIVDMDFTITIGVVLVVASIITVVIGLFMDRIGKNKLIIPFLCIAIVGAIGFFFADNMVTVIIAGLVLMTGYLVCTAIFGAKIRDYTPVGKEGMFQGIRMIFAVLIPMVTGPYIGLGLSYINGQYYTNSYGITEIMPNNYMFLGVAGVLALTIIPVVFYLRKDKRDAENANKETA